MNKRHDLPIGLVKAIDLVATVGLVSATVFFVLTIWVDTFPRFVGQIFGGVYTVSIFLVLMPTNIGGKRRRMSRDGDMARSSSGDGSESGEGGGG